MKIRILVEGLARGAVMEVPEGNATLRRLAQIIGADRGSTTKEVQLMGIPFQYQNRLKRAEAIEVETLSGLIVRYQ